MALHVVPLTHDHVPAAADLMAGRYRRLRGTIPQLPPRYGDEAVLMPMLEMIVGCAAGVAAMEGERLVGFIAGVAIPEFKGRRAVLSPEWANAAVPAGEGAESRAIYERMYSAVADAWAAAGCSCHLIGQFPDDVGALDGWFHQGFGLLCIDGVRDLSIPDAPPAPVEVRRAGPADVAVVSALSRGLSDHGRASPIFLDGHPEDEDAWAAQLEGGERVVYLALASGTPTAYMRIGPASDDACGVIMDEGTASITGAYAAPDVRRLGVATALLRACLAWAAERGYARCAVDWESANIEGNRFWRCHFAPVCYSLMRVVDEALVAGG